MAESFVRRRELSSTNAFFLGPSSRNYIVGGGAFGRRVHHHRRRRRSRFRPTSKKKW